MARLASVLKQGFYPAPPEAIAGILRHLKIPDPPPDPKFKPEDVNVLDPCAGEGKALAQLAEGLGVSWGRVFAVELNASRAARIAEAYPDVRLLGLCTFEATRSTRHSFSMIYRNAPEAGPWAAEAVAKVFPDTHFSLAVCHDIQARADRFANRADGFCRKGLSSDLGAPSAQAS
jgi:hypothetical protein